MAAADTNEVLRFITCGSVDDGKSSLLGRLLHDAGMLPDDQVATLARDSARQHPEAPAKLDFALLTDGLAAEREQGITIDVAYRYFHTARRNFIVADCPGHEQYTRNMATGASTASLAVVLVDARKGLLAQTQRHSYICALMGIGQVILAVNKMDLVGFDATVFENIRTAYQALAVELGIARVVAIPVVATDGDHIATRSPRMPWHTGPTLLEALEEAPVPQPADGDFRLPIQLVVRPHQDYRGYAGTVEAGCIQVGDEVMVQPGKTTARVATLRVAGETADTARRGQAVMLTLHPDVQAGRGQVLASADAPCPEASQFACHVLWMSQEPMLPGRAYDLLQGTGRVRARITTIKHKVDVHTQAPLAARRLELNEVGACNLDLDQDIAFEPFATNAALGGFVLVDLLSRATVACGRLDFALRRSANIHWQHMDVDKAMRSHAKAQKPLCVWFTGLSGSGKSTIANFVEQRLTALGHHTYLLDGDNVRHGLNNDLGFTAEARVENIRRLAEVAHLMLDAGLVVLVCAISPFAAEREFARGRFEPGEFVEVYVDAPLAECERRDPKGLYRKARAGLLANFTGIDSPYEPPANADIHLMTMGSSPQAQADGLAGWLAGRIVP
ncbi:MAG TPA: adenylyl-sulfate kinase [Pinirhizobacter sp.]|uniref:adenylyl-sulfate kinase n=1 Tax=Pinirhizobacter sp. TaxID=2950432 RepID=UPI002BA40279|nr:adenylyl-sulfate kinase [Pinirhizobacter sp.]HMH67726.1 adenylyl-sulfate kinase [Pinirhizobacter sp.]